MGSSGEVFRALEQGLVVVVHWLSCSAAGGVFPDQGSNLCLLNLHADSPPLSYQGSLNHIPVTEGWMQKNNQSINFKLNGYMKSVTGFQGKE